MAKEKTSPVDAREPARRIHPPFVGDLRHACVYLDISRYQIPLSVIRLYAVTR
jgi:hypothetical protein